MTYFLQTDSRLPERHPASFWHKLRILLGFAKKPARYVVIGTNGLLTTHPNNVWAVANYLRRQGHYVKILTTRMTQ